MTNPKSPLRQKSSLDAAAVAEYLAQHPDFFENRDDLLVKLLLPHPHGGDVSLVERQVSLLRERQRETRKQLDNLVKAASANNEIFTKCQRLVLSLLEAVDSASFFKALEKSFKSDFKCNAYSLMVFDDQAQQINHFTYTLPEETALEYVGGLMRSKRPTLGVLRPAEQDFLFRHASTKVKSAAVLYLRKPAAGRSTGEPYAMLALGSSDPLYFQADMGTIFIGFIADVLARQLPSRLSPNLT